MTTELRIQRFSGGLDSFAMWHLLGKPQPVYVRYGHKYDGRELETIQRLEKDDPSLRVTFLDGPGIGRMEGPDGHIPLGMLQDRETPKTWTDYDGGLVH